MEQSPVVACFPVKSVIRILKVKVPGFPEILDELTTPVPALMFTEPGKLPLTLCHDVIPVLLAGFVNETPAYAAPTCPSG
jgi:hypothetical protein